LKLTTALLLAVIGGYGYYKYKNGEWFSSLKG
jgi:hypothetical protein